MDDLLRSLASGPVPTLAPPESVRRRGDQRRRRARAAVAGVSAVVVLTVAGVALGVAGDATGRPDSLVPATSGPTPSTRASAAPAAAAPALAGALLQASDLHQVRGGTWFQPGPWQRSAVAILDVCGDSPSIRGSDGLMAHLVDGRGGTAFTSVLRMPSAQAAQASLAALTTEAAHCPTTASGPAVGPHGEDGPAEAELVPVGAGAVGVVVTQVVCSEACEPSSEAWAVVAVGDLLGFTVAHERGQLATWVSLVRARLAACAENCPAPEQPHPQAFPSPASPHVGDVLWAVTIGAELDDAAPGDGANERARAAALLLGYGATITTASCIEGSVDPGATMPESARLAQVFFATEQAAGTFREGYRSSTGEPASEPRKVRIRCLT